MGERWVDDYGQVITVHEKEKCEGEFCTIHNASVHSLCLAPQKWDFSGNLMLRECVHGEFHVDLDDIQMRNPIGETNGLCTYLLQCDKCCKEPQDEPENKGSIDG